MMQDVIQHGRHGNGSLSDLLRGKPGTPDGRLKRLNEEIQPGLLSHFAQKQQRLGANLGSVFGRFEQGNQCAPARRRPDGPGFDPALKRHRESFPVMGGNNYDVRRRRLVSRQFSQLRYRQQIELPKARFETGLASASAEQISQCAHGSLPGGRFFVNHNNREQRLCVQVPRIGPKIGRHTRHTPLKSVRRPRLSTRKAPDFPRSIGFTTGERLERRARRQESPLTSPPRLNLSATPRLYPPGGYRAKGWRKSQPGPESSAAGQLIAILSGRLTDDPLEDPVEVRQRLETHFVGDLADPQVGVQQQVLRLLDPQA
jgi:hypothetical protein